MASSVEEARSMIMAARPRGRLLAVGLYKRFFPSSRYLQALCRHHTLGPLRAFTVSEGGPFRWPAASPSFFDKRQTPGGVLLDIGVHVLDLLDWLLGEPAEFHYADDAMGGLETNAILQLRYAGGIQGQVQLSRDWDTPQLYEFVFERGLVRWSVNDANGLSIQLPDTPAFLHAALHAPVNPAGFGQPSPRLDSNAQSFLAQLQNVVAAVQGRETLLVDGESGLRSLRLIEACYARRTLLEQPWLTPAEARRARTLSLPETT